MGVPCQRTRVDFFFFFKEDLFASFFFVCVVVDGAYENMSALISICKHRDIVRFVMFVGLFDEL